MCHDGSQECCFRVNNMDLTRDIYTQDTSMICLGCLLQILGMLLDQVNSQASITLVHSSARQMKKQLGAVLMLCISMEGTELSQSLSMG